jgi:hypothetical protein
MATGPTCRFAMNNFNFTAGLCHSGTTIETLAIIGISDIYTNVFPLYAVGTSNAKWFIACPVRVNQMIIKCTT